MASAAESTNATYTLYGFDNDLDWRRTCFLEPLPASRYCSYCGRVCGTMMMLPCCHIVCVGCYGQCITRNYACVLDAKRFRQHDVAAMVYTSEDLASKHIRCWNADRGCDTSGPLFQILKHYRRDCQYHIISCPRCGKAVSHGDVVAHLAQGCSPGTYLAHLPPQTKQAALMGAMITDRQLEGQNSAPFRIPGTADQNLSHTHDERADIERRAIASEPLEEVFKQCHQETRISPTLQPGEATGQDEPSSSRGGAQPPANDSCDLPVVVGGVSQRLPSTERPKSVENKLSSTHPKYKLVAIKKACTYLEDSVKQGLESVCSKAEPSTTTIQEESVSSSEIASAIFEAAQQESTQYPDSAATEAVGTLSVLQLQGPGGLMASVATSKTATVPGDLASPGAEKQTAAAADSGEANKEGKWDSLQSQPAMSDSAAPSRDKFEGGFSSQRSAEADGRQDTTSVVSISTIPASASANPTDEALFLLLSGYINSVSRFLETVFKGIDDLNGALGKLEPGDLAFILRTCEQVRAQIKDEYSTWGAMRKQIQQGVTKVFDAVQGQVHVMCGEDLFQDPVGKKIDHLMNMGKHILRERITESVPVQWHLDRWSELKAKAVATGKAADYYSGIRATFFGYLIVPGVLLEKTASKLLLRSSFYVRKGDFDDFLEWPIEKEFTLSVLHPTDKGQTRFVVVDTRSGHKERCTRPGNEVREPVLSSKGLKANSLDTTGHVEGDRLLLQFEVK